MKWRVSRRWLLGGMGVVALGGVLASWRVGSQLTQPANRPVPLPAGSSARVVSIAADGHDVAGWWSDRGGESAVVLLLHPLRGDRLTMQARADLLGRRGFSVLSIDLQAHGETPGQAITFGRRESADVQAALRWLRREARGRPIGVIGWSMGGAAVLLGPQPAGFDAVVLEAVYPRLGEAVVNRLRMRLGRLAPAVAPLLLLQLRPRLHIRVSDLEPIRSISHLGAPVLLVAGEDDEHTTLAESRELFRAAAEPKQLWVVEGVRHEDFLTHDPIAYEEHVIGFLAEELGKRARH